MRKRAGQLLGLTMTTSTYDFCGLSKSPQHAKPPHLRARLPSVVVSSRGPLELDCCPEAKPQSQHSSNQHNEVRQGGTRSLPAVVPPREMMELELGEFTCTQIKEAISALKVSLTNPYNFKCLRNCSFLCR